jgi:hypothetical protein
MGHRAFRAYSWREPESAGGSRTSARLLPAISDHAAPVEDLLQFLELFRESPPCAGAGKGEKQLAQAAGLDLERDRQARPPAAV